jgi:ketosteroid isomerase-like protein
LAAIGAALLGSVALGRVAFGQSADAASVEQQVEALRKLMINPERQGLDAIFADQLTYGHSDGRVQKKEEVVDSLVNHRSVFHSITLSQQSVTVSGDVAVVRHRFQADAVSNGTPGHPDIKVLQVWQKQGGQWRLLVRQAH